VDGRTLWTLYAHADAGFVTDHPFHGSCGQEIENDGNGA
jgi:hypothetical protein